MTAPLGRLQAAFAAAGIELDGPELADALWLAARLPTGAAAPVARSITAAGPPTHESPQSFPGSALPPRDAAPAVGVHAAPPAYSAEEESGRVAVRTGPATAKPVRLPGPRALSRQLKLGRALRPLKRSVPGMSGRELDEAATAAARADTGVPYVVDRPVPERWLRLVLVVDDGLSMQLWRGHARELQSLLERCGAFREIRTVPLDRALQHPYANLFDLTGRTMVLVLTDGTRTAWADGRVRRLLNHVARLGPTAVVHTLPRRMWPGTFLTAETWHVAQHRRGSPNVTWTVTHPALPGELLPPGRTPIPVLETAPASIAAWTKSLTAIRRLTPLSLWTPATVSGSLSPRPAPSVTDFRRTASRDAYRLAAHLAAYSPVTVPVMRLVQACLPGAHGPTPLAEVLLGGLLRPLDDVEVPAFEFTPDARYLLLEAVPTAELVETGRRVAGRMADLVGRSSDFPAWIATPAEGRLDQGSEPFARIEAGAGVRLGITQPRPAPLPKDSSRAPQPAGKRREPVWMRPLGSGGGLASFLATDEDTVYVSDTEHMVAVQAGSGRVRWKRRLEYPSAPSVANGVVYVSDTQSLYALDARDGSEMWSWPTGEWETSRPAVADGVVYVGGETGLWAVDAETGEPCWSSPFRTLGKVQAAPAVADGLVFVASIDHRLRALEAGTGRLRWTFEAGGAFLHAPVVANGVIYAPSNERLYALEADSGELRWSHEGWWWSPSVANGLVCVGGVEKFVALDASTGVKRWAPAEGRVGGNTVISGGVVYAAHGAYVWALDLETGEERWTFHTGGGRVWWAPVVNQGGVYVGITQTRRDESLLLSIPA